MTYPSLLINLNLGRFLLSWDGGQRHQQMITCYA